MASDTEHKPGVPWTRLIVLTAVIAAVVIIWFLFADRLSLDSLASQETALRRFQADHPVLVYVLALVLYVAVTGFSIPGAAALSLVYGWYFGWIGGVVLVSFASTAGATVAFLLSRYLFRDVVQRRFGDQLATFNQALEREGAFYLFTLRLIPAVPFFAINVVMGLTRLRTTTFWWVSQLGMLAGTLVYVYAGSTLPSLAQLADPSQLKPADIQDWDEFIRLLRDDDSGPMGRIASLLPEETTTLVRTASSPVDRETQSQIVSAVNGVVKRPDFALISAWQNPFRLSDNQEDQQQRDTTKRLTKANRAILVAALPQLISPPRPVVSFQLLIAFLVLGLFPLVVKKLMQRLRPPSE